MEFASVSAEVRQGQAEVEMENRDPRWRLMLPSLLWKRRTTGQQLKRAAVAVAVALGAPNVQALDLVVNELGGGTIAEFTYLVNLDNTSLPFQDPFDPDPSQRPPSTAPTPSHSPIMAAGDQNSATILGADGQPLPTGRYLVSVRADGYKLWGQHFTLPDDEGTLTV